MRSARCGDSDPLWDDDDYKNTYSMIYISKHQVKRLFSQPEDYWALSSGQKKRWPLKESNLTQVREEISSKKIAAFDRMMWKAFSSVKPHKTRKMTEKAVSSQFEHRGVYDVWYRLEALESWAEAAEEDWLISPGCSTWIGRAKQDWDPYQPEEKLADDKSYASKTGCFGRKRACRLMAKDAGRCDPVKIWFLTLWVVFQR